MMCDAIACSSIANFFKDSLRCRTRFLNTDVPFVTWYKLCQVEVGGLLPALYFHHAQVRMPCNLHIFGIPQGTGASLLFRDYYLVLSRTQSEFGGIYDEVSFRLLHFFTNNFVNIQHASFFELLI